MVFQKAQIITNTIFEKLSPINVFHKEMEKATYIPAKEYENKHILFRKQFVVGTAGKATIKISADDYYKLYINGEFVTQGPAPSYNFAYYYNEVDITSYLVSGENTIAVHTYYQGVINRVWVSGDLRHMLVAEIENDGEVVAFTDTSWKTSMHTAYEICGERKSYQTTFCESYNASAPEVGFEQKSYDDSNWDSAVLKQNAVYKFVKQETKQLDIYKIKPQVVEKNSGGYFVDIGQEIIGYVTFEAKGNRGDIIYVKSAEELTDDNQVRYALRCNCTYKEQFILGDSLARYSQYDYKGFRYVQIDVPESATIDKDSIEIIIRHYPYQQAVQCPTDDEDMRRVWELCANTLKYGTQEVHMDCPTREKGQYLGDATVTAIAYTILTGDTIFMKKLLRDFANTSFISKSIMAVSTSSFMQEIADYSLQFPLQVLWLYNYENDIEFLKEMYPYIKNIIDEFAYYEREDGLIENVTDKWNLVDWPVNMRDNYDFELTKPIGSGVINVLNAFYYGAIVAYEKVSDILGVEYTNRSTHLKTVFNKAFFCAETMLYVDSETSKHSSIHANMLPLLFSMNDDGTDKLVDFLDKKGVHCCGVYMAMFMLMALKNAGATDAVKRQLLSDRAWLKMLSQGATTCFEAWGKEDKVNCSLFHPWATAPIIILSDTKFPF